MSNYRATVDSLRLVGTAEQIERMLAFFRASNCLWYSNGKYYSQRGEGEKFAYYMNNIQVPATTIAKSDDPQVITARADYPANFDPIGDIDEDRENHYALYGEYPELC